MLNFPTSSTAGTTYQTGSSATYQYNGQYWEVVTPPTQIIVNAVTSSFASTASYVVSSSYAITSSYLNNTFIPIYVQAGNSAAQTVPSQTVTTITNWTNSLVSTGSNWNATTGVFTTTRAGYYRITAALTYAPNSPTQNTEYNTLITIGGGIVATGWTFRASGSGNTITPTNQVDSIRYLNIGDLVEIQTYHNLGSSLALQNRADVNLVTIQELPNFISK
jgi:hypothetical protein